MHRRPCARWRAAVALCLIALLPLTPGCGAGGLALGDIGPKEIMDTLAHVERIIDRATQSGDTLILHAASEARLAVQNFQNAFADSLDKLDELTSRKFRELEALINRLESAAAQDAEKLLDQAQQIVNTLPLSNQTPQLTSYGPRLIVRSRFDRSVQLEVRGNFIFALDPELRPYLDLGDARLAPSGVTTQSLFFDIPLDRLPEASSKGIATARVQMKTPYKEGRSNPVTKVGTFSLLLGVLPETPGKIVVHWKSTTPGTTLTYHQLTRRWSIGSSTPQLRTECGPDLIEGATVITADPLKRDSMIGAEGFDWSLTRVADPESRNRVCYEAWVGRHGQFGGVSWHLEYDLQWSTVANRQYHDEITLRWGKQDLFEDVAKGWRVDYDFFNQQSGFLIEESDSGPYLAVKVVEGTRLKLTAPLPPTF